MALVLVAAGAVGACPPGGFVDPMPGRSATVEFPNARGTGRHVAWAPRSARLAMTVSYALPTDEYGHGVLGDAGDAKALRIDLKVVDDNRIACPVTVFLGEGQVFEDTVPRLGDVDLDGIPDVIAVQSSTSKGARLVVYDRHGAEVASTPHIGQRNRWLAPLGAADLDGDGRIEIAYVDRPHLARVLRLWRFDGRRLTEVAALEGVTNHQIGWNYIAGGVRDCGAGPEMIVASGDWRRILSARWNGRLTTTDIRAYSAAAIDRAMACR